MISNKKVVNYKVAYPFLYYNSSLGCFSVRGHLEDPKKMNFNFENFK
jgi:hypothetical protein